MPTGFSMAILRTVGSCKLHKKSEWISVVVRLPVSRQNILHHSTARSVQGGKARIISHCIFSSSSASHWRCHFRLPAAARLNIAAVRLMPQRPKRLADLLRFFACYQYFHASPSNPICPGGTRVLHPPSGNTSLPGCSDTPRTVQLPAHCAHFQHPVKRADIGSFKCRVSRKFKLPAFFPCHRAADTANAVKSTRIQRIRLDVFASDVIPNVIIRPIHYWIADAFCLQFAVFK